MIRHMLLLCSCLLVLSACGSTSNPLGGAEPTPAAQETPTAIVLSPENPTEVARMIEVVDPWVRASVDTGTQSGGRGQEPGAPRDQIGEEPGLIELDPTTTTAFMTLINKQDEPDSLIAISTSAANEVQVFYNEPPQPLTIVPEIKIPANGQVAIERGPGYHLVLQDLTHELQTGDTITMTLTFWNAGEVAITAPVRLPYQSSQQ